MNKKLQDMTEAELHGVEEKLERQIKANPGHCETEKTELKDVRQLIDEKRAQERGNSSE
jgi:hypothetical protein